MAARTPRDADFRLAGAQDQDPTAATDCATNSLFATQFRIAEFQAFTC